MVGVCAVLVEEAGAAVANDQIMQVHRFGPLRCGCHARTLVVLLR